MNNRPDSAEWWFTDERTKKAHTTGIGREDVEDTSNAPTARDDNPYAAPQTEPDYVAMPPDVELSEDAHVIVGMIIGSFMASYGEHPEYRKFLRSFFESNARNYKVFAASDLVREVAYKEFESIAIERIEGLRQDTIDL